MVSSKILWNSVISTKDARFAGADIINMYLETPLDQYEYMKMPIVLLPASIIDYHTPCEKAINEYVYTEIQKGMYGLPQAGILASKLLKKRFARHGYYEQHHTPGLSILSALSGSTSAWMILALNILDDKTYNTYMMCYKKKTMTL
jgi:hypothetical protein